MVRNLWNKNNNAQQLSIRLSDRLDLNDMLTNRVQINFAIMGIWLILA